jgi:energy-coupling factor transporter ATP-binding protein EcfA2
MDQHPMKLRHLWISKYKNLSNCEVEFSASHLLNAIIGNNGSGKSNLIEAILYVMIGVYFKKAPPFDFSLEFEAQGRQVLLLGIDRKLAVHVDGERKPLEFFAERLRDGSAQVYYPEMTFVYYSGECQRVRRLIRRYQQHFARFTRQPDTDRHRPLFVESSNEHAQVILLALFAHRHRQFLEHLGIKRALNISIVLRSPAGFDPSLHEPKLWNTVGAVRRIVAAIDETAFSEESRRHSKDSAEEFDEQAAYSEMRIYRFSDNLQGSKNIGDLADRLAKSGDNLFLALEHLRARGIFCAVSFQLAGRSRSDLFEFDQLSEGEKQLLAVVGALHLLNQPDNLVLLDEPDTHLNPHWTWDYPSMLTEACDNQQRSRSMVLMATHNPVMISGLLRDQVVLAHLPEGGTSSFTAPLRHPRGQGIANLLCSSEFFGLPSSLDKETQKLLDERLRISIKQVLTETDRARLRQLNRQLEIIEPGVSERDPEYVAFLRERQRTSNQS